MKENTASFSQKNIFQDENLNTNQDIYWIHHWSENYFDINEKGHVVVKKNNNVQIDLYEVVQSLIERGIETPILFRFDGIIRDRIDRLNQAFCEAIEEFEYTNRYQLVYPIKVNQQKHVVNVIRNAGKQYSLGLEVGSKPELICVLSLSDSEGGLLLCNGYKDAEYIELALLSRKLGRRTIIIIEQLYEIKLVFDIASQLGIEAEIGFRMKSSMRGSGRWASSGGELAKFGLSTHEIMLGIEQLKKAKKDHWLKLLHYHVGSQITSISSVKKTLLEATRIYAELAKLCPSMSFFDVGGGLGVDYEGSKTISNCSMNYTMQEYARDIVSAIKTACEESQINEPIIISESGRAIVAHHSVLITEVIDVSPTLDALVELPAPPTDHEILKELCQLYQTVCPENCHEILHDAYHLRETTLQLFIQGNLNLEERAFADRVYYHLIAKIRMVSKKLKFIPEDIEKLDESLLDLYFCNFSVFQSLPDAWAINQLFPVMPIHRLNEKANRHAQLVDVSCDSDGKIDQFSSNFETRKYIQLHEFQSSPYFLGVFLVGAYQEILGGLHNLFGDTNAVHIDIDENGDWEFSQEVEGDTVNEVLSYVQYQSQELIEALRISIEKALKEGRLSNEDSAKLKKRYKEALESYTYLVV